MFWRTQKKSQRFTDIKMGLFRFRPAFFQMWLYFHLILVDLPNIEHRYNKNLDMYVKSIGACLNGKRFCLNRSSFVLVSINFIRFIYSIQKKTYLEIRSFQLCSVVSVAPFAGVAPRNKCLCLSSTIDFLGECIIGLRLKCQKLISNAGSNTTSRLSIDLDHRSDVVRLLEGSHKSHINFDSKVEVRKSTASRSTFHL